jgi:transposase
MRKSYPSDITREQFAEIESLLLSARKITAPRKLDLYDVFCAVLYLLKTACQWRMLPSDFPKWRSVHSNGCREYTMVSAEKSKFQKSQIQTTTCIMWLHC